MVYNALYNALMVYSALYRGRHEPNIYSAGYPHIIESSQLQELGHSYVFNKISIEKFFINF